MIYLQNTQCVLNKCSHNAGKHSVKLDIPTTSQEQIHKTHIPVLKQNGQRGGGADQKCASGFAHESNLFLQNYVMLVEPSPPLSPLRKQTMEDQVIQPTAHNYSRVPSVASKTDVIQPLARLNIMAYSTQILHYYSLTFISMAGLFLSLFFIF